MHLYSLCFYCPDEVFHSGVHHRGKWRQFLYFNTDGLKYHIKAFIEHGVTVMYQIAFTKQESIPHITHISGNLRSPVAVGIMSNTTASDFSWTDIHKEQQMPPFKTVFCRQFSMGKISSGGNILLDVDELQPVPTPSAFLIPWTSRILRMVEVQTSYPRYFITPAMRS